MRTTGQVVGEKAGYLVSETVAQSGGVVFGVGKGIIGHPLVAGAATLVGKGIREAVNKATDPMLHAKITAVGSKVGNGIKDTALKSKHIRDIKSAIDDDVSRVKLAFEVIDTKSGEVTTPDDDDKLDPNDTLSPEAFDRDPMDPDNL